MNSPFHIDKPPIGTPILNLRLNLIFYSRKLIDPAIIKIFPKSEYAIRRKRVWQHYQRIREAAKEIGAFNENRKKV